MAGERERMKRLIMQLCIYFVPSVSANGHSVRAEATEESRLLVVRKFWYHDACYRFCNYIK